MAPMDFRQNATPFSVQKKMAILEDNLNNIEEATASTHSAPHSVERLF